MKKLSLLIGVLCILVFFVACKSKNENVEFGRYYAYVNGVKDETTWIELKKDFTWESSDQKSGRYEVKETSITIYTRINGKEEILYTAELAYGMFTVSVQNNLIEYAIDGRHIPTQALYSLQFESYIDFMIGPIYAYAGSSIPKPEDPIRDGYTFMGWYHHDILVQWPYVLNGNSVLFAKWEEITNQFNRPVNLRVEGSYLKWDWIDQRGLRPLGFEIYINDELVSTQFTPQYELKVLKTLWESKTFHFEVHALSSIDGFINGVSRLTYHYAIEVYDVNLNYNDGTNRVETIQTNDGKINLPTPSRLGYQFNGWYISNDGGHTYSSLWNSNFKVLENISLYADWVTSVDGGTKTVLSAPQAVLNGTRLSWPAISTASGYDVIIMHGSTIIYEDYVSSPYYDFSNSLYDGDEELSNLTIKVRSRGDGGFTTVNSSYITRYWAKSSSTSSNLRINHDLGVVYWESEETSFHIALMSTDGVSLDYVINQKPEYLVPDYLSADTYFLNVNGQIFRFDYLMLAAPQHITSEIIDGMIHINWDEVDKATHYLVYVNDIQLGSTYSTTFIYSTDNLSQTIDSNKHFDQNRIYIRSMSNTGDYFVSLSSNMGLETYQLTLNLGDMFEAFYGYSKTIATVIKGGTRTLPNHLYLSDYRFCGWYTDHTHTNLIVDNHLIVQSDLELYAKWENNEKTSFEIIVHVGDEEHLFNGNFYETMNFYAGDNMTLIGFYRDRGYTDFYPTNGDALLFNQDIVLYAKVMEGNWFFTETSQGYIMDYVRIESNHVVIPNEYFGKPVYALGASAFTYYGNYHVESVIIPNSVVSIGSGAFYGLYNLVAVSLPNSVTHIEDGAFDQCSQLTYDVFDNNLLYLGHWLMGLKDKTVQWIHLREDTVGIYKNALSDTTQLFSISIPKSVVHIGSHAFSDSSLSFIEFSNDAKLKYIGYQAFKNTRNLMQIQIPDSVEIIDDYAFYSSFLFQITISENSQLKTIGESAFGNTYIYSFYIPNQLEITAKSFIDMHHINEFVVSDQNVNYTSQNGIVYSKDMKTLWVFPSALSTSFFVPNGVKYIAAYAFYKSNVYNIFFPETLESIGDYAFTQSVLYGALDLPREVKTIGSYAFQNTRLTSLNFTHDSKLETIGMYAFQETDLTTIRIPDTVVSIQRNAFSETYRLNSVYIPVSVTYIGRSAFNGSSTLIIYTRHAQMPVDWDYYWNSGNRTVRWNYSY